MTETMTDPLLEALQDEFALVSEQVREDGVDDADRELIIAYTESLARRHDQIARAKDFHDRTVSRLQREIESIQAWKGAAVEAAVARNIGKKRSIDTPGGRVGFRSRTKPSITCAPENKDELILWCEQHVPGAVTTSTVVRKTVKKETLAEHLQRLATQPMVKREDRCPFAQLVAPGQTFYFKPRGASNADDTENQ